MSSRRPKFTRTKCGSLTVKGCIDLCTFWYEEADFDGNDEEAELWRSMLRGFINERDMGLDPWTSSPIIEKKIKSQQSFWDAAFVPWDNRAELAES